MVILLCQSCGEKDASIHFTKIINGSIEEKHLCDNCAKKGNDLDFDLPFSFHKLFTGLIDSIQEKDQITKDISCAECGLTYNKFLETGKFGCSNCFKAFPEDVASLLKGIHGHDHHTGKIPSRANSKILHQREIDLLRNELEQSITKEDFEKAALLRDEINKLKEKLDGSKE